MKVQKGYFRSVKAMPGYKLDIEMATNAHIEFDFSSRLDTIRFGALKDETVFGSANTDGDYIVFEKKDNGKISISALDFMDLLLVDRTGEFPAI